MVPSGVGFEWTIRFGDILTMGGAILVAFSVVFRRGKEETKAEEALTRALTELGELKTDVKALNDKMSELKALQIQVTLLMKWYDELRRGIGFVPARIQRGSVDGEY